MKILDHIVAALVLFVLELACADQYSHGGCSFWLAFALTLAVLQGVFLLSVVQQLAAILGARCGAAAQQVQPPPPDDDHTQELA